MGQKKGGSPKDLNQEPPAPQSTVHTEPLAHGSGVAARAAILYPYEAPFNEVIRLTYFLDSP